MIFWLTDTLEQVLTDAAKFFAEADLSQKASPRSKSPQAFTAEEIKAAESRLGRALPDDLREFYKRIRPVSECPDPDYGVVGIQPLDDDDLQWLDSQESRARVFDLLGESVDLIPGLDKADILLIGYTPFGDWLLYCENLKGHPDGTIVLTDHDGDGVIIVGESFRSWLARYSFFEFEPSIVADALDSWSAEVVVPFLEQHLALNPHVDWTKQKLEDFKSGKLPVESEEE
jgi:hypothetical protein